MKNQGRIPFDQRHRIASHRIGSCRRRIAKKSISGVAGLRDNSP